MGNQKLPCFSYIGRETLGDQGLGEKIDYIKFLEKN